MPMSPTTDLADTASAPPAAWPSLLLGHVGTTAVKVLRMDGRALPDERHACTELLLVLDGRLELAVEDTEVTVLPGRMFEVAANVRHAVRPGSRGTLVVVEVFGG